MTPAIKQLTEKAKKAFENCLSFSAGQESVSRRRHIRHSFFQSVKLCSNGSEISTVAFTRDISRVGFGLLLDRNLPAQTTTIRLSNPEIELEIDLSHSRPCGGDWFSSYAEFTGTTKTAARNLLIKTLVRKLDLREMLRHPYFARVDLASIEDGDATLQLFSRDISLTGIGLFMNQPTCNRTVTLDIPGSEETLKAEIQWCEPCGYGWYLGGATFDNESAKQLDGLIS